MSDLSVYYGNITGYCDRAQEIAVLSPGTTMSANLNFTQPRKMPKSHPPDLMQQLSLTSPPEYLS